MSAFGWSYPPGCNGTPFDEEVGCAVCGARDLDKCVCPTCRQCGCAGDPDCYYELCRRPEYGHRHLSAQQHRARAQAQARDKAEADYWEERARLDFPDQFIEMEGLS